MAASPSSARASLGLFCRPCLRIRPTVTERRPASVGGRAFRAVEQIPYVPEKPKAGVMPSDGNCPEAMGARACTTLRPFLSKAPIEEYGFVPALGVPTLEVGHYAMHVGGNTEANRPPRPIVVYRQIPPRNFHSRQHQPGRAKPCFRPAGMSSIPLRAQCTSDCALSTRIAPQNIETDIRTSVFCSQ